MPEIEFTETFQKCFQKLPNDIKKKARNKIWLLAVDPRHPSLQTKPIQGAPGIFEARIDLAYSLTYERKAGNTLLLRVIGPHDETLKHP